MEQIIKYKGYRIKVKQDSDCESPDAWCNENNFLVYDHRDFDVRRKGFAPKDIYAYLQIKNNLLKQDFDIFQDREELEDELKGYFDYESKYWIFPVEACIHSGVSLSLFSGTKQCRWDSSVTGYYLCSKEEWKTEDEAREYSEKALNTWNDYLFGNVYGCIVEKPNVIYSISKEKFDRLKFENDLATLESDFDVNHDYEQIDSCWGYYGDPEKSGLLDDAKSIIDNL